MPSRTGTDAITYLRVSTESQVKTDYDPEGISIPAQRKACQLRAREADAAVVAEFVEPGRSARSVEQRPEFKAMVTFLRENPNVKYVIVYALSRFARNRYDDAALMMTLDKLGVTLLSATERNLDSTPTGKAMHGMIAVFNQYQSDASGEDIRYKMSQKVIAKGGTINRAPLGYRNVRDTSEGREIRTVALDHERDRAALVKETWQLYATGEYTIDALPELMTGRGLMMRATPKRPEHPVERSYFARMLRSRYYLGEVRYKGEWHPGRHEPLIDLELFDRVQRVLDSHSGAGVRHRKLEHYLKGVFTCARCGSRMIYIVVQNRYEYFFCVGTRTGCDQPYIPAETLERSLAGHYYRVRLTEEFRRDVLEAAEATARDEQSTKTALQARVKKRLAELEAQEDRYLDLLGDPDWPQEKLKAKLASARAERAQLTKEAATLTTSLEAGHEALKHAVAILEDPYTLYTQLPDPERRLMTLTIFEKLTVDVDQVAEHTLRTPFSELVEVQTRTNTPAKRRGSHLRCQSHLRSGNHEATPETKKDTLQTEGVLDVSGLTFVDLFEHALLGGHASTDALWVETVRRYTNAPGLAHDLRLSTRRICPAKPHRRSVPTIKAQAKSQRLTDRLPSDVVTAIVDAYNSGTPSTELARDFAVSKGAVVQLLRSHGVQIRNQGLDAEAVHLAKKLYVDEKLSLARIGERFGVHATTVHQALRAEGVEFRSPNARQARQ